MDRENADRQRRRNQLAMEWDELGHADRSIGDAERAFGSLLASLGDGGQTPVKVGLARMFAGWRDRKLRASGHFDRLERETMKNEEE